MIKEVEKKGLQDKGLLTASFRSLVSPSLTTSFLNATHHATPAQKALEAFQNAATELQQKERVFSNRARPTKLSVMKHLRPADHMSAMHRFNKAKERLMDINPVMGKRIVQQVKNNMATPKRKRAIAPRMGS